MQIYFIYNALDNPIYAESCSDFIKVYKPNDQWLWSTLRPLPGAQRNADRMLQIEIV